MIWQSQVKSMIISIKSKQEQQDQAPLTIESSHCSCFSTMSRSETRTRFRQQGNRWVLRSALNFVSDGEVVREVGRDFQRKGPEKAKADLAKECLTRVKKKWEQEDDRKPGRLGSINISDSYLWNNLD
ncbi:hypothetical protein HELRODRAFT_181283 [Helobdella robusta]|uniref:Uncharacterized protein n=1 Tax=Helobdella robusta TaxID=6412 RepID=T1FGU3_HELRO|nr:hypothetical protein HELRODRAFT_181283 [Helobdella robusta]ESN93170.1 hypothetical protein HELRODRAFT_181283 [Helobdella robusta]